jgi:hypothetical protein
VRDEQAITRAELGRGHGTIPGGGPAFPVNWRSGPTRLRTFPVLPSLGSHTSKGISLMTILRSALFGAAIIWSSGIYAAGFGLEFGADPSSFDCSPAPSSPGDFLCSMPPKPHSAFETYAVKASPKHGICWIKGIGRDISDNRFGSATKSAVDEMAQTLNRLYGPSKKIDIILPRALWDEPNEWLMSIVRNERFYGYEWKNLESKKPMLASVVLAAEATGPSTGYIALDYYATFHEECSKAISEAEAEAL